MVSCTQGRAKLECIGWTDYSQIKSFNVKLMSAFVRRIRRGACNR